MQKFRSYLYCNEEMLTEIINQIPELNKIKIEESNELNSSLDGGANLGFSKLQGNIASISKERYDFRQSSIENFINWSEERENTLNLNNNEPTYKDKGIIAIVNGTVYLPDQIQDIELIQSIIGNETLFNTMPGIKEDDMKIAKMLKESENIPIVMELNKNILLNCKVIKKFLKCSVDDFLENMEEDVTIIAKIDNIYEEGNIEIFDIAKEILKVNRTVRRRMNPEQLKNVIIYEQAPLIKVTPLIIYK